MAGRREPSVASALRSFSPRRPYERQMIYALATVILATAAAGAARGSADQPNTRPFRKDPRAGSPLRSQHPRTVPPLTGTNADTTARSHSPERSSAGRRRRRLPSASFSEPYSGTSPSYSSSSSSRPTPMTAPLPARTQESRQAYVPPPRQEQAPAAPVNESGPAADVAEQSDDSATQDAAPQPAQQPAEDSTEPAQEGEVDAVG